MLPTDPPRATEPLPGTLAARTHVREGRITNLTTSAVTTFGRARTTIGADPRADVVVDDASMSRLHCEIRIVDGAAFVRDLGSRNGTLVDRVPILDAPLRDGAVLTLGRTELRFDLGPRHVAIPLAARERFGRLRGGSVPMRAAYAQLEAAAASTATVLLLGESGTGKELAAESIHLESARRDGPLVVVDCGALPATLIEDELFGHEAGAFTGATTTRIGAFEAAHGGTVFLDEIGELALELQPKLLRVLERREIQRVGGNARIPVDVRVVAATNRDLQAEVNARRFRTDLYFRLAVLIITLPPLRERSDDLPVLVDAILDGLGDRTSPMARALANGDLLPDLLRHTWPGNVRELRNYIEACVVRQERADDALAPSTEPELDLSLPLRTVRDRFVRHIERRYLEALLRTHGGNVSATARAAGIDRVHLHRLLKATGLR